jgi:drug/metabolite transporter (DMT)-like permease
MKTLGLAFAVIGALLVAGSFFADTAPEGTYNIGLLQNQMMIFSLGALTALVGTVIASVGHALERMEGAGLLPPAGIAVSPKRERGGHNAR